MFIRDFRYAPSPAFKSTAVGKNVQKLKITTPILCYIIIFFFPHAGRILNLEYIDKYVVKYVLEECINKKKYTQNKKKKNR